MESAFNADENMRNFYQEKNHSVPTSIKKHSTLSKFQDENGTLLHDNQNCEILINTLKNYSTEENRKED